ncbi:MAG: YggU family protein [Candidatus Buchananbacteria bacterium]|nr:YggU family protein [Candidatus Buchananbacteria bacterium]
MAEKIYTIKVIPGSKKNKIIKLNQNSLKIKLTAPPEKGKANKQLIEFLGKYFKIPKNNIEILAGQTNKTKIVKICI